MKELLLDAGVNNISTVFLFSDNQILEERYLEFINNLLNSGEIPNLWETEEKDKIKTDISMINLKSGGVDEPD